MSEHKAALDEAKTAATGFMLGRELKPHTAKGYEALVAFYYGWFRGNLPSYVVICLSFGRQDDLIHKESAR